MIIATIIIPTNAAGSSTQIALFVVPLTVIIGWALDAAPADERIMLSYDICYVILVICCIML